MMCGCLGTKSPRQPPTDLQCNKQRQLQFINQEENLQNNHSMDLKEVFLGQHARFYPMINLEFIDLIQHAGYHSNITLKNTTVFPSEYIHNVYLQDKI